MAQEIPITSFGNQTLSTNIGGIDLVIVLYWNGRNNRYFISLTNDGTGATILPQSMEPFSALNIEGLGLPEGYLLVSMSNPIISSTGKIEYTFESIGETVKLIFALPSDIPELEQYGKLYIG